jgi:FKBP-type peptidyl-prolyl cis-trans isomerase 2
MDTVSNGSIVKLHYVLTVEGRTIDNSREREPFTFEVGAAQVIPGFERAIQGMKVGERKSFRVSPEEGYGHENPEGVDEVPLENLSPGLVPEVGMTVYATGEHGQTIPGRITEVREQSVVINVNHPLAGKTLEYDMEIIDIQ